MSTEISTQTQPRGLALQSFDDAMRFASLVSKSDFAPKDFKGKPESCLLAIQHGSEVGLSPMQSLQSIAVINGRPTIWGDAALALVQSSPVCEYVREYIEGEGDGMVAVCEAKRRGYPQPTVVRFSMQDAKRAGLTGKQGPWTQYPSRMLALRARGFALRNAFADALRGLITAEEAQDYQSVPETPQPVQVVRGGYRATVSSGGEVIAERVTQPVSPQDTSEGKARLAIGKAKTLAELDKLRRGLDQRATEGVFTTPVHAELVALCQGKAEMLISAEEREEVAT